MDRDGSATTGAGGQEEREGGHSERRTHGVIETAVDGVVIIDSKGTVQLYNPACERIFGYRPEEVVGRNVRMLMPPPYRDEHDAYIARYLRTREPRIIGIGREVVGQRKDGSTFPMDLAVGEARQNGEAVFVGMIRDISERYQTQQRMAELQRELVHVSRLSAMGEMASTLAHELNQPLTAVMNYVQAARRMVEARDRFAPDRIVETMEKAVEQAARAGQIIRRLREFIRRGETERSAADLNRIVREASALGLVGAREAGIMVRFHLARDLPPVLIDPIQIQQVVLNLVRNSVDALPQVERRELVIGSAQAQDGFLEVTVRDTGPGLAGEVWERLFEPFVTTKANGMGIGLSISRSIIEAHGGRLWAEPNPDGGVCFRFTVPVAAGEPDGR